jgi:hypothetical protein
MNRRFGARPIAILVRTRFDIRGATGGARPPVEDLIRWNELEPLRDRTRKENLGMRKRRQRFVGGAEERGGFVEDDRDGNVA